MANPSKTYYHNSQIKSINLILYRPKNGIIRHSEFEKMEGLDDYTKELGAILNEDGLIGSILREVNEMKGVVKSLIDLSNGNKLTYHFETLKQLHSTLNITD